MRRITVGQALEEIQEVMTKEFAGQINSPINQLRAEQMVNQMLRKYFGGRAPNITVRQDPSNPALMLIEIGTDKGEPN